MLRNVLAVLLLTIHLPAESAEPSRSQAFAALPNWSGVWEIDNGTRRGLSGRSAGGVTELRAKSALAAPPPYNAEWAARYQAEMKDRAAMSALHARSKSCLFGFPVIMESPRLFEIVITPEVTMVVFDNQEARRIYTDGKPHPPAEDLWPTRMGNSIGHWEGDTLVIETVARIAGPIGFAAPVAKLSEQARFTERIRMQSPGHLVNEMVIEDPVAFARPWRLTLRYKPVPEVDRVRSYDCEENDRNPVVDGQLTISPQ
jgi:hypothetical protein